MVSNRFGTFFCYAVGNLTCFYHCIYLFFDESSVFCNLLDDSQIFCRQACCFFCREERFHFVSVVYQFGLVFDSNRYYVVHNQIAQHACFNLDFLGIHFPFYFVACFELFTVHYSCRFEHTYCFRFQVVVEDNRAACFAIQTSACCFFFPFVAVSVAIEADRLTFLDVFADYLNDSRNLRLAFFNQFVYIFFETYQLFSHGCVQGYHGTCTVGFRTRCTEFETVSCKCKR